MRPGFSMSEVCSDLWFCIIPKKKILLLLRLSFKRNHHPVPAVDSKTSVRHPLSQEFTARDIFACFVIISNDVAIVE